jgi:hypothetical protein
VRPAAAGRGSAFHASASRGPGRATPASARAIPPRPLEHRFIRIARKSGAFHASSGLRPRCSLRRTSSTPRSAAPGALGPDAKCLDFPTLSNESVL